MRSVCHGLQSPAIVEAIRRAVEDESVGQGEPPAGHFSDPEALSPYLYRHPHVLVCVPQPW